MSRIPPELQKLDRRVDRRVRRSVFSANDLLLILVSVASCVALFLLLRAAQTDLDAAMRRMNTKTTWLSVIFISAVNILVFSLHKKITLEGPTRRILDAAARIGKGDFSVRIKPFHSRHFKNEFDVIIEDLNKMAAELSGVETMKTDFIANVSHELKTPLAVIANYTALLQTPDLPEDKRLEYAAAMAGAAERLNALTGDILRLNKLETQQIFLENAPFDLGDQLCVSLIAFDHRLEQAELTLETELEEGVTVHADAGLLAHVWENLLSNAVKFTPPGGTVRVSLTKEKGFAVVRVSDTGCGMSEEVLSHAFEKFYQGDPARSVPGNGLGLALVKRVVDISGGAVEAQSEEGSGSTFTVRLPLQADRISPDT